MANPEHLAKLKEGVEVWNQWRKRMIWSIGSKFTLMMGKGVFKLDTL